METAYSILLFFHDRELSSELDTASAPRQTFIEEQAVINKILGHLQAKGALPPPPELLPATRGSPDSDWFA